MKRILVLVMVLAFCIIGCKKQEGESGELMTITLYDIAANYQGMQPGWFAKVFKDELGIELNIIAPQMGGGDALFQTRSASGDLGDIVVLDNAQFLDCIKAGLVQDISKDLPNMKNVMVYSEQIQKFNSAIEGANGKIYGIPAEMTNTSPTSYSLRLIYTCPQLPWDYYTEIGAPQIKDLNGYLDALEKIQKNHPTNEAGDKAYAISLWADWDQPTSIENVNQTVKWYGVESRDSLLIDTKGNMKALSEDSGEYRKMLKFYFDANQRGILDPDSGTQNWDQVVVKMQGRRIYLHWYEWQRGFWNSPDHGNLRQNYTQIPADDMHFFQDSDNYYGNGRVWGVGSKVTGKKREKVIEVLEWMASPRGLEYLHNGIKDFNYTVLPDGTYVRTPEGEVSFSANPPVPAEWGGGGWNDGNQKVNIYIAHFFSTDPNTGYPYEYSLWPAEIEKLKTVTSKEYAERFGASDIIDYVEKNNQMTIVPLMNMAIPSDSTDMQLIRSQCGTVVKDTSWKMIFAKNEAEFNKLWSDMKTQIAGFGWDKLVEYDKQKNKPLVDARNAAMR